MAEKIIPPFGGFVVYPGDRGNIFERMFGGERPAVPEEPSAMTPLVDIYENDKAVIVTTDLPGVKKDDIHVSMTGDTLTINAEVKREERKGGHWVKHERRVGTYVRSLQLSGEVNPDSIAASFGDGILELTITKPKNTKAKAVEIQIE